jgi:hypothetical protein
MVDSRVVGAKDSPPLAEPSVRPLALLVVRMLSLNLQQQRLPNNKYIKIHIHSGRPAVGLSSTLEYYRQIVALIERNVLLNTLFSTWAA